MDFCSNLQGEEKFIVKDVYSGYDHGLREVFNTLSGEFALPHVLTSDCVGGWTMKDLNEDEGSITIPGTMSDETVFLQITGTPVEEHGEALDPVESQFIDQHKKRKSRSTCGAATRESVQSKSSKCIDDMNVDYRCHYRMLIKDFGLPLYEAETPFALLEALLHGMVGEWKDDRTDRQYGLTLVHGIIEQVT